jgi:hypothetical protein
MKSKLNLLAALLILLLFSSNTILAQSMGISNSAITPDASSILEMRTTGKGMLIPRMTETERNNISSPATGLMLYNTSSNQYNFYNGSAWVAWGSTTYLTVDAGSTITTSSTSDIVVTDMTKTALEAGTYTIFFNGQVTIPAADYTTGFSTAEAKADLSLIYNDITNIPVTDTHLITFGSGEILTPGVYLVGGAMSITGSLTLDGQGDSNALFIIRGSAAFNTSAGATVTLINGAQPQNVYWVAQDAIGFGANTKIQGTLFSNSAAIAVGSDCIITGRLLTKSGAVAFGPGTLSLPEDFSTIDFRSLTNFTLFTGGGGVANSGISTYTGDIGTNLGAITGFDAATVNGTIFQAGSTTTVTPVDHMATFSLYKNGVLIPNSSRTRTHLTNPSDISLQGFSSIAVDDVIDVRWKIDAQNSDSIEVSVINRILTLVKVGN